MDLWYNTYMTVQLHHVAELVTAYPALAPQRDAIAEAVRVLVSCFRAGGKLLVCGNGGSAADAEHIVGELGKGFRKRRPLPEDVRSRIQAQLPDGGRELAAALQGGLPAINLAAQTSLYTAFANDVEPDYAYAQQVVAYGRPSDVLLGISTSGNARNVAAAVGVARALGLVTVGLTGQGGGRLARIAHHLIAVPETETYKVQELHLPVYHALCAEVEEALFPG